MVKVDFTQEEDPCSGDFTVREKDAHQQHKDKQSVRAKEQVRGSGWEITERLGGCRQTYSTGFSLQAG